MNHHPVSSEPLVKGVTFLGIFKYIKTRPEGEALLAKVVAALSPEAQQVCRKKVIAVVDYPYPVFVNLLRTVDQMVGRGDLTLCRELGVYAAIRDVETVYNLLRKRAQPEALFRDGPVVWKSYYPNAGSYVTIDAHPDHSMIRIVDFPQMDPAHCRLMDGWMSQALVEAGGTWIEEVHEVRCTSKGDPYHEYVGRWKHTAAA